MKEGEMSEKDQKMVFLLPVGLMEDALRAGWLAGPMERSSEAFPFNLEGAVRNISRASSSGRGQEAGDLVGLSEAGLKSRVAGAGASTAVSSSSCSSSDAGCWTVSAATVMKLVLEAAILMGAAGRLQELRRAAGVLSKLLLQCRAEEKEEFLRARGALLLDVAWLASNVQDAGVGQVLGVRAFFDMAFCHKGE
jgi:hypothetical protein